MAAMSLTPDGRTYVLADGSQMPMLGLGVWQVPDGPECVNAVRWALELGYRHIDTAQLYGNEQSVGQGLRESGVPRDEVFITTKFHPGRSDPAPSWPAASSGSALDQVDLYLVHWPQGGPTRAWPGMEAGARARPRPFDRRLQLQRGGAGELLASGHHRPRGQPGAVQPVQVPAPAAGGLPGKRYRPRGLQPARDRPVPVRRAVKRMAKRHGRTPAQVLLRWCLQQAVPVIPKSTHRERIEENAHIFDFTLSAEDMAELDALDKTRGTDDAHERKWW